MNTYKKEDILLSFLLLIYIGIVIAIIRLSIIKGAL
jgi:hypothetical protein